MNVCQDEANISARRVLDSTGTEECTLTGQGLTEDAPTNAARSLLQRFHRKKGRKDKCCMPRYDQGNE